MVNRRLLKKTQDLREWTLDLEKVINNPQDFTPQQIGHILGYMTDTSVAFHEHFFPEGENES